MNKRSKLLLLLSLLLITGCMVHPVTLEREFNIVSEEKPCVIEGENDKTYLGVIMPMRI